MLRRIRKLLLRVLGLEGYLRLVSRVYLWLVRRRLVVRQYPELFHLDRLVRPGDVCLDIGANLGYYAVRLSALAGPEGRVLAVEPVPLFARILRENLRAAGAANVEVLPYALGAERGTIRMGTPEVGGVVSHGRTRVAEETEEEAPEAAYAHTYTVEMRVPDELFAGLDRLDFVKCDVEGYETHFFPAFTETIRRHRPVVQIELNAPENKRAIHDLLAALGYRMHALEDGALVPLSLDEALARGGHDLYFVP